jgi:hypothetical protein
LAETHRLEIAFVNPLQIKVEAQIAIGAPTGKQFLAITLGNFVVKIEGAYVMYTLPIGMAVKMQVSYVDAAGNPAAVDAVSWASSNDAVLKVLTDASDNTICVVHPVGALGQVQVVATADVDLGDGVRELMTVADINIVAGEAVAGTISPVGEPSPIEPTQH